MTPWATLTQTVNLACLNAFGVAATLIPQNLAGPISITVIEMDPAYREDLSGGPRAAVRLFFNPASIAAYSPQPGDTVIYNAATYALIEAPADVNGGAVLKLRIT